MFINEVYNINLLLVYYFQGLLRLMDLFLPGRVEVPSIS